MEAAKGGRRGSAGAAANRDVREAAAAGGGADRLDMVHAGVERMGNRQNPMKPAGLLMAPPRGWGEQGGLGERPTRPKLLGGPSAGPLPWRPALLEPRNKEVDDGNWDAGDGMDEPGFRRGAELRADGTVNMDDEAYLEFEEEEEVKPVPGEQKTWDLLARYMASFKPNTTAMFNRFIDEVWHPRAGIEYSEKGKNYYMITLFSKGDYDFIMRGGPWIFNQNALIVTDLAETVLNSVPVWVKIYDVPWGKQDREWGMKYGDGLGEAMEVDVPASEQHKKEYLRVRVKLPYDRRLQPYLTVGVKGKPLEKKRYRLQYERLPYYCTHCGCMGHKTDVCEKKFQGGPSLNYDAHELRCSPQKKFEHRPHYVPPPAKRGLSFASFGSAESHKGGARQHSREQRRASVTPERAPSHVESADDNAMPPLEDDPDYIAMQAELAERERQVPVEVEENLVAGVDAMLVEQRPDRLPSAYAGGGAAGPIVEFPDEDGQAKEQSGQDNMVHITMTEDMLSRLHHMHGGSVSSSRSGSQHHGPRASDMIPALQGLSSLQVSFGSVSDTVMAPADTILGKRAAEEAEVQGERLELSLGLDYAGHEAGTPPKKGKTRGTQVKPAETSKPQKVYTRAKSMAATGHKPSGKLTRPNVWSRQEQ
jgi:hypothetical protein